VLVLAHRGAHRLAAENSVAAMTTAVHLGADGVELDVHCSADGVLVVRHDAETPAGPLGALTHDEIAAVVPETPTLVEVLDACRDHLVNVEVKDPDPRASAALAALLGTRAAGGVDDDVLVSSFDLDTIDRFRAAAPRIPTGLLSFGRDPLEVLATTVAHGHAAVHPDVWTLCAHDVDAFVVGAHRRGIQVNVWTVNDTSQMGALQAAGVDAVITDDTDLYGFGSS
jgi:glycerophosphoryl diester phosphodiesterase